MRVSVCCLLTLLAAVLSASASQPVSAAENPLLEWHDGVEVSEVDSGSELHSIHSYFIACPESPDGEQILFYTSTRPDAHEGELRTRRPASGAERVLVSGLHVEDAIGPPVSSGSRTESGLCITTSGRESGRPPSSTWSRGTRGERRLSQEATVKRKSPGAAVKECLLAAGVLLSGCGMPQDPDGTTQRVRGAMLRVGISHNPPWTDVTGESVSGIEADLCETVTGSLVTAMQVLSYRATDLPACRPPHG